MDKKDIKYLVLDIDGTLTNSEKEITPKTKEGIIRVMQHAPERQTGEDGLPIPPYKVYNIGNNQPENLLDFVTFLQEELLRAGVLPQDYDFEAHKRLVPMQPGDVYQTNADTTALQNELGFKPDTPIQEGVNRTIAWFREFYKL